MIDPVHFEILPFGNGEAEAAELPERVRLSVTCSPKHGSTSRSRRRPGCGRWVTRSRSTWPPAWCADATAWTSCSAV